MTAFKLFTAEPVNPIKDTARLNIGDYDEKTNKLVDHFVILIFPFKVSSYHNSVAAKTQFQIQEPADW